MEKNIRSPGWIARRKASRALNHFADFIPSPSELDSTFSHPGTISKKCNTFNQRIQLWGEKKRKRADGGEIKVDKGHAKFIIKRFESSGPGGVFPWGRMEDDPEEIGRKDDARLRCYGQREEAGGRRGKEKRPTGGLYQFWRASQGFL
jgi:hypothetical protein